MRRYYDRVGGLGQTLRSSLEVPRAPSPRRPGGGSPALPPVSPPAPRGSAEGRALPRDLRPQPAKPPLSLPSLPSLSSLETEGRGGREGGRGPEREGSQAEASDSPEPPLSLPSLSLLSSLEKFREVETEGASQGGPPIPGRRGTSPSIAPRPSPRASPPSPAPGPRTLPDDLDSAPGPYRMTWSVPPDLTGWSGGTPGPYRMVWRDPPGGGSHRRGLLPDELREGKRGGEEPPGPYRRK